ncbi:hypothetical protein RA086_04835 [Lactiplantibacillus sp. WILCCON 0030]|uniref:Uncharacterized protein n=1 Tax=Lactiplantibacillus brownii TaxID=3069269 RepID=A0ABU1A7P8_9LACO|nr:hypothetical protein [Lactiplantibacillus brownii]MDQ7936968.1 hypothetical protein [Lactiplantibacillus brownii]
MDKQDIVQVKMPQKTFATTPVVPSRAIQLKVGSNKSVIIYNKANSYIVDAVLMCRAAIKCRKMAI